MKTKKEIASKTYKSLYTGTGAASAAAWLVGHFAPGLPPAEAAGATGALAGILGTGWRIAAAILESRYHLAKYL